MTKISVDVDFGDPETPALLRDLAEMAERRKMRPAQPASKLAIVPTETAAERARRVIRQSGEFEEVK